MTTTCRTGFVVERGQWWAAHGEAASRTVRVKVNPQSKTLLEGRLVVERGQRWAASRTVRVKVNPQSKTLLEGRLYWGLSPSSLFTRSPAMLRKTLSRVALATAREVCGHLVPRKKARSASYGAQHQLVGRLYLVASSELSFTRTARGKTVLGGVSPS